MDTFDQKTWLAHSGDESSSNPRAGMVGKLIDETLTKGMERQQIQTLLGPPDSKMETRDLYSLGRSPWGIDLEHLAIDYVEDRLRTAFLLRD